MKIKGRPLEHCAKCHWPVFLPEGCDLCKDCRKEVFEKNMSEQYGLDDFKDASIED